MTTTKIYSYGAHIAHCPAKVDTLLRKSMLYYNALVELENLRRAMFTGIEEDASTYIAEATRTVNEATVVVDLAFEAISKHRERTRSRAIPVDLRSAKEAAIERKKEALATLREVKAWHRMQFEAPTEEFLRRKTAATSDTSLSELSELSGEDLRKKIASIRERLGPIAPRLAERLNAEILETMMGEPKWSEHWKVVQFLERVILSYEKEARRISGLPHGTYALVDDAVAAAKRTQKVGDLRRKWIQYEDDLPINDSGRVGVQLPDGLSIADLCAGNHARFKLRVETPEERAVKGLGDRSARWKRRNIRAVATIAIDSSDSGWEYLDIPISYYRSLPPNAIVKWVWLFVQRHGMRLHYDLQITIVMPDDVDLGQSRRAEVCIINPGWRHFDDGSIRVAYVVGSDGHWEDLRLPATEGKRWSVSEQMKFSDSLRSASDSLFNEARKVLVGMLPRLPESIQLQCTFIAQWKDHTKLQRAVIATLAESWTSNSCQNAFEKWVAQRKARGLDLMPTLDEAAEFSPTDPERWYLYCWLRKDRHLYQMAIDISRKAARDRNQMFSIWAKRLSERYQRVALAEGGLKKLAKKTDEVASSQLRAKSRVATGTFVAKVKEKFGKPNVIADKGVNASRTCVKCGHLHEEIDLSRDHMYTCSQCGYEQDQDETNCRNRLTWLRDRRGDEKTE
jgi:hypothetical protein